ncbi:MAG: SUMF1/EgtB/PvdO family nonheme iron enzyme [Planctomycetes bacterium]|nr:SUMF1/EgtB/PvdO family nonheme iron enzyme [Planctomycetota bacterium]
MGMLQKAAKFVKRCGAPSKFAARLMVQSVSPGPAADLVGTVIDYALEGTDDEASVPVEPADFQPIEQIFDLLLGELRGLVKRFRALEAVPDLARQTLLSALATSDEFLNAARELGNLSLQLTGAKELQVQLAGGENEFIVLGRRALVIPLDYLEEEKAAGTAPRQLDEPLGRIEAALTKLMESQWDAAESMFTDLCRQQPRSAALAVGLGAALYGSRKYMAAAEALVRAYRLRPGDAQLEQLSRAATRLSGAGQTPSGPAPRRALQPGHGDLLDGWFLEKSLGRGGYGQIFQARKNDKIRAVKILHPELSDNPSMESRFKREIVTLAGLGEHPNLIRIDPQHLFGRCSHWKCWYYVMELVKGLSLQELLTRKGRLPFDIIRDHFTGVAEGLALAHSRGIVHRDIKPSNILIRSRVEEGKARFVLADFGLAGGFDPNSRSRSMTAVFAAPEQFRTGRTDPRSDIFSMAATMYYSLMYGDAVRECRFKAKLLGDAVPFGYRELLERCLDADPDERPADAGEFLRAWRRLTDTPINRIANSIGMSFAWVPPGRFLMGSPPDEAGRHESELPHAVEITGGFHMGVCPVTQGEYLQVMGDVPSRFCEEGEGAAAVEGLDTTDFPVEQVSWHDAVEFCRRLTERESYLGNVYDLPTEAEWEYACRAGTSTSYSCGISLGLDLANYAGINPHDGSAPDQALLSTSKVGSYWSNPWGFCDMHGNVWEWCKDWHALDYYGESPVQDPAGPAHGAGQVVRGGSWRAPAHQCRSASRGGYPPDRRLPDIGFRVVMRCR